MNFGIAYIQKKTIQKKFIYPLVFLLLLIPVLYFAKGSFADETGTDGSRIHSTRTRQMYGMRPDAVSGNRSGQSDKVLSHLPDCV